MVFVRGVLRFIRYEYLFVNHRFDSTILHEYLILRKE